MAHEPERGGVQTFTYEKPDLSTIDRRRKTVWLGTTQRLFATIQAHREGGEVTLHSHTHLDGFWFVLSGRVRFYSDETTVCADLGSMQGVLIPRGEKYWFQAYGPEDLEIFQIECSDRAMTKEEARAERGALLRAPTMISSFWCRTPGEDGTTWLANTDRLFAAYETIPAGRSAEGARRHNSLDSVWYVLDGEIDVLAGDGENRRLGPQDGVLIRQGEAYRVAAAGGKNARVLKVYCSDRPFANLDEFTADLDRARAA